MINEVKFFSVFFSYKFIHNRKKLIIINHYLEDLYANEKKLEKKFQLMLDG